MGNGPIPRRGPKRQRKSRRALAVCYDAHWLAAADCPASRPCHAAGFRALPMQLPLCWRGTATTCNLPRDQLHRRLFTRQRMPWSRQGWAVLHGPRIRRACVFGWFWRRRRRQLARKATRACCSIGPSRMCNNTAAGVYEREVQPLCSGGAKRVFVVISDALRWCSAGVQCMAKPQGISWAPC